jgi:hypothetical protein
MNHKHKYYALSPMLRLNFGVGLTRGAAIGILDSAHLLQRLTTYWNIKIDTIMVNDQARAPKEVAFDSLPFSARKLQRALQTVEQEQAQLKKEKSLLNRTASIIKKRLVPQPAPTARAIIPAPVPSRPNLSRSTSAPISRSYAGSSASSSASNVSLPTHPPVPPPSRTKKSRQALTTALERVEPDSPWGPPPPPVSKRPATPARPQLKPTAKSAPPPVHGYPRTMIDKRNIIQSSAIAQMPTLQLHAPKAIRPVPAAKSAIKGWEQIGPWQQPCFFAKRVRNLLPSASLR